MKRDARIDGWCEQVLRGRDASSGAVPQTQAGARDSGEPGTRDPRQEAERPKAALASAQVAPRLREVAGARTAPEACRVAGGSHNPENPVQLRDRSHRNWESTLRREAAAGSVPSRIHHHPFARTETTVPIRQRAAPV